jgi:hypothetical protein
MKNIIIFVKIKQIMKKSITLPLLLIAFILLSSSTNKKSIINSIVGIKWHVDNSKSTTSICFKKDGTFWHYYSNLDVDSLMFSRWGVDGDKMYLFDENKESDLKHIYIQIVSCEKDCMTIKDMKKNEYIKFLKK